jgi:hypothetical protein
VIETLTQLVALLASIQMWMMDPALAWPAGYSWTFAVKYTITDAQLLANAPSCCRYLLHPGGTILRTDTGLVYLLKH